MWAFFHSLPFLAPLLSPPSPLFILTTSLLLSIGVVRQGVLDGHSSTTSERNFRNETAHSGNFLTDIELIECMDRADARRADSWKRTFENLYSISFSDRRLVTGNSVEICNIYGTIRSVRPWATVTTINHTNAVKWCEELLRDWRQAHDYGYWDTDTTRHISLRKYVFIIEQNSLGFKQKSA